MTASESSGAEPARGSSPPALKKDEVERAEADDDTPQPQSESTTEPPTTAASDADKAKTETSSDAPPLPDEPLPNETLSEDAPPLPDEEVPQGEDDGWEPMWDATNQAYYFYNRFSKQTQWENPRVPEATGQESSEADGATSTRPHGGYNPAIHGDYDPNAAYAVAAREQEEHEKAAALSSADPVQEYAATGSFNRFTGRWQASDLTPDNFNDESKSRRQMQAFFDVDAAANSHDGRSLRAERAGKKLSKKEVKAFRDKRREKKEEKRRAWLRD